MNESADGSLYAAAATGMFGAGKTVKAITDNSKAGNIIKIANKEVEDARETLEQKRLEVRESFDNLGKLKLTVLERNVMDFIYTFEKIKNVDFTDTIGIDELRNLHIDETSFKELKQLGNFAVNVAGGAAVGAVGGALTAFGAYSAAMTFASASTGTAIATLSGAAATNATLAFFGGGSLAAGGPLLMPSMKDIIVTPVSSHTLYGLKYVAGPESEVRVVLDDFESAPIICPDGRDFVDLEPFDSITIRRHNKVLKTATLKRDNFFSDVRKKIVQRGSFYENS